MVAVLTQFPLRYLICLGALLVTILNPALSFAQAPEQLWMPGEYIIKYNQNKLHQLKKLLPGFENITDETLKDVLNSTIGADTADSLLLVEAEQIKAKDGADLDYAAVADLFDAELIEYISPNFIRTVEKTPNDPSFSSLWGLNQAGNNIDIDAPEAWDELSDDGAQDIVVGIIDTGIDYAHPDLSGNMWTNSAEANGVPNVDDDLNGVIDDIHGYNAITNSGNPMDDHNHGTHCAGTIGASGNNGVGITGVAWKVKLMALKFLNSSGSGSDADAIKAIYYAVTMKNRGGKLRVLNNSWGGSGYNPALLSAIQAANSAGILFVAAAGNSNNNNDTSAFYPANYNVPNVVTVAAVDRNGTRASFSNYGATSVDLAAPGVGILSTVRNGNYMAFNGTSMAAPHVSGVAALMYSRIPQLSPQDVKDQLLSSVKPVSALNGLMLAPGIVNAKAAIANPANVPPDLAVIPNQTIYPRIRIRAFPLIATDKEGDDLTFTAQVVLPSSQSTAASVDRQYNLTQYLPQYDNYYQLGEKRFISASGATFLLFSDGTLHEISIPYYYYRATVDPSFYSNPQSLVTASELTGSTIAGVSVIPGSPPELEVRLAPNQKEVFPVNVTVSDGNRTDTETFYIEIKESETCS